MAESEASQASSTSIQVEEQIEGDRIETNDYFFCKIGEAVSLTSNGATFDGDSLPTKPIVVSERFGLVFVAHTSGFCVAKIKDVITSAKEIKDKGEGCSIQECSLIDVLIGRVSILALSLDSLYLGAVVGGDIHCFSVDSLLAKDKKPINSSSLESGHIKDMLWVKDVESSFVVLTNDGKLHVGGSRRPLEFVKDDIDAVGRNVDGQLLAVVRRNILIIFSTNFKELIKISLPLESCVGDSTINCIVKVDSLKWVRSDSIVVGSFLQTEDGMEEGYFVQVIMSKDGKVIDGSSKLSAVCFNDLFPGIVDDIVPFGCGPHLFMEYLEHCGLGFVSNRKNTDQHIMLFTWSMENNEVSVVDIERDSWLPRIELQENGDENLVLGLCIDKITIYENVKVQIGVEEQKELLPHCLLLCLTLEGKLVMYHVASIVGPQRNTQTSSATASGTEDIPAVGTSDLGGTPQLEEERAKQSTLSSGPYDLSAKKIGIRPDEIPVRKDPKPFDMGNFSSFVPNSGVNLRGVSSAVNNTQKACVDVHTCKTLEHLGHSSQEMSNQLGKNAHMGGTPVVTDGARTEKLNIEQQAFFPHQPLGKAAYDSHQSVVEKTGSSVISSIPGHGLSSTLFATSDVSNANSAVSASSTINSTSFKSTYTFTNTVNNTKSFLENFSFPSDSFNSSLGKGTNHNQKLVIGSDGTQAISGITKMQSRGMALQDSVNQSHTVKVDHKISPLSGKLSNNQESLKQFCNVQHLVDEMDRLMECIDKPGGFRDVCTTACRSSLETLEEGMEVMSKRSREWQFSTEKQLQEVQVLLDKTVQVLARKTHIVAIIRQTTDRQYWELWDRQKLSSELDLKRQNLLNLSQDLINQMIGLEKHFNALELNLFGENGGVNMVSQSFQYKRNPPRSTQSLHTVQNALISQLAAAQQLSEFLAKQMDVLSIRSPLTKEKSVKKQLFESIGMPCPGDYPGSPEPRKMVDYSANKKQLVSHSGSIYNDSRRNQMSGLSSHEPETARRRRESLDRNWANFEAPKTTVKRMLIENQPQNNSGSLSSLEKRLDSSYKLGASAATYPRFLSIQDRIGSMDTSKELRSEASAFSVVKRAGTGPDMSKAESEGFTRSQDIQRSSFSRVQTSSSSLPFINSTMEQNNKSGTDRLGSEVVHLGQSESVLTRGLKPSSSQFNHDKSTIQRMQPQIPSSPLNDSEIPVPSSKETASMTNGVSLIVSTPNKLIFPTLGFPPGSTSTGFSSFLSTQTVPTLPVTPVEVGLESGTKLVNEGSNQVSPAMSPSFPVSSTPANVNSLSSKDPNPSNPQFTIPTLNSAWEPPKSGPQPPADRLDKKTSLATTQHPLNLVSSASEDLKFQASIQSAPSNEVSKEVVPGSLLDLNRTVTLASDLVSKTQSEKTSAASELLSAPLSDSAATISGKSPVDAVSIQEDEMEEEAPEMNQTSDLSLGSLSGFGIGSVSSSPASRSNPFGASITGASPNMSTSVSLSVSSGELFRPASFSFQSLNASQQSQPTFGSANLPQQSQPTFGSANPQQPSSGGFGQPAQIGMGQQALGSVLGSFGQSRQIGGPLPWTGFGPVPSAGSFQNAAPQGGLATAAATGGGFARLGNTTGGFAGGGGFAGIGNAAGGFAGAGGATTGGGGFPGAAGGAGGGFGAFSQQSSGFGGGAGGNRQPSSELFTQMRK